jgi:hypothetical protein
MFNEKASSSDAIGSQLVLGSAAESRAQGGGVFHFKCYDKDGNLKWEDSVHNLVVNVGLKDMNDKYFSGSAYTAAWYLGLVTGPGAGNTYAAADTMASHAGWTEDEDYSELVRQTATFGAATTADPSVIDNSGSVAVFSMNATTTIAGAFLTTDDTKGGTSGTLFSVSNFTSPGDRAVVSGDTLNVTYQFSLDAA